MVVLDINPIGGHDVFDYLRLVRTGITIIDRGAVTMEGEAFGLPASL